MWLTVGIVILGILFYICLVSFSYQRTKYKHMHILEKQRLSKFNSPNAWLIYTFGIIILSALILISSFTNIFTGITILNKSTENTQLNNFDVETQNNNSTNGTQITDSSTDSQ